MTAGTARKDELVLLVDDDDDARELLGRALDRAGYRYVVAADGAAALSLVQRGPAPNVAVIDVVLGARDRGGLELLSELRRLGMSAPVIVITAYADLERVKIALNEGAQHFLEKPFRAPDLIAAIERVLASASPRPLDRLLSDTRLTDKERVVARHLLEGLSSSEIAALENNSPKTIRQHVSQIYAKYGVSTRAEFFRLIYMR